MNLEACAELLACSSMSIHRRYINGTKLYFISLLARSRTLLGKETVAQLPKKLSEFYVEKALRYLSEALSQTMNREGAASTRVPACACLLLRTYIMLSYEHAVCIYCVLKA
jgi:hypothetical protein